MSHFLNAGDEFFYYVNLVHVTAPTVGSSIDTWINGGRAHKVYAKLTASADACTVKVEGSNDGTTWSDLHTFTSSGGVKTDTYEARNIDYRYIRANATTVAAGEDVSAHIMLMELSKK